MASPFSIFRKHQGVLLAVFGVALMVAFVVLPAIIQMQQAGGGGGTISGDTVLTWTGGEVSEADVGNIQRRRNMTLEFLVELQKAARARRGGEDMNLNRDGGMMRRLSNNNRTTAVETMILAQKAEDMGLRVDDAAVRAFLHAVTDNVFANETEMNAAIDRALGNSTTEAAIFNSLRQEILAQQVLLMGFGGATTTPSEAWEYYNRLNRRVSAEFIPVKAEDYLSKVDDPSDRELQEFFDAHKNDLPQLNSPEPGFKIPRKAEFYYVWAEFADFLKREKAKVTDAEVQEYYEENKESFRIEEQPATDVDEIDPDDPRSDDPRSDDPRSAEPNPPAVEVPSVEDEPAGDASPESEPGTDDPAEEAPDAEASDEETTEPEASSDESDVPEGCQDEEAQEENAPDNIAEENAGDEPSSDDDAPAAEDNTGAAEEPSDNDVDVAGTDNGDTGDASSDDLTLPPAQYRPLEDVADQIRGDIATPRAQKSIEEALGKVKDALSKHDQRLIDYEAYGEGEDPGLFDGKALARELGLGHDTTGMTDIISLYEKRDKLDLVESTSGPSPQAPSFLALAFRESLLRYQPIQTSTGRDEKIFVSWKVAEEESKVPELAEVKSEVVKAWKMEQARPLAQAAAEDLASGLNGETSLKGQVGGSHKVIAPAEAFTYFDPFSLIMMRFQGQPPQLNAIEGVEDDTTAAVKEEVFKMRVGEIRVVPNADKSVYYVVRVAGDESTTQESREEFMQNIVDAPTDGPPPEFQYVGSGDKQQIFYDWYEQVEDEYEVQRIRPEWFQQ